MTKAEKITADVVSALVSLALIVFGCYLDSISSTVKEIRDGNVLIRERLAGVEASTESLKLLHGISESINPLPNGAVSLHPQMKHQHSTAELPIIPQTGPADTK